MLYWPLSDGAAMAVLPLSDSNTLSRGRNWRKSSAYYFTGLDYRMLVCPNILAEDRLLLQRPGLYLKTNLPLGAAVYFPALPANHATNDFIDDLAWMVDSYLFKFNSSREPWQSKPAPCLHVDYANRISIPRGDVFDHARVIARRDAERAVDSLNRSYAESLLALVRSRGNEIVIGNYAETTLLAELCTHNDLVVESNRYFEALAADEPEVLRASRLTGGVERIVCTKRYNRAVLSFYLGAMREPFPHAPGSYINTFKNLYNVLEYLMGADRKPGLREILDERVGTARLREILSRIRNSADPQSGIVHNLIKGEPAFGLLPLSESDPDLAGQIAKRLRIKRNAVIHSKKTHKEPSVRPGSFEASQLELDLALMRPIAEEIVTGLAVGE